MKRSVFFACLFSTSLYAGQLVQWQGSTGPNTPPDGNDFIQVACGRYHRVALRSNGKIECWGYMYYEGLCDVPDGNYIAIATSYGFSVAVRTNGSLVAWGNCIWDECMVPAGDDYIAVAVGNEHGVALKTDGSLVSWGSDFGGKLVSDTPAGNDFITVAAYDDYSMALKNDGTVVQWGGSCNPVFCWTDPNVPDLNDFVLIAAGQPQGAAIRENGELVVWCYDDYYLAPPTGKFLDVASGTDYILAVRDDGSLFASGRSNYGQCDVPEGTGFVAVAASRYLAVALSSDESAILDIQTEPRGLIGIDPEAGSHEYYLGEAVYVRTGRATNCPAVYDFERWSGDISDPCAASQYIILDGDKTITAHYLPSEKECGDECHPVQDGDLNGDCRINLTDWAIFADKYLDCTHPDCD